MQRWIIHIDMDAYFAAVEQRDHPEIRGKPVIIGGLSGRGVVSTASYEARRFGVHSAMPMTEAQRRCPNGIYLPGDHRKYARISMQIMKILENFSPLVEPLSLDEAFLDVSGMDWLYHDPVDIAKKIQERIYQDLQLTASAGVAPNKFLAKMASEMKKPNGLTVIRPGEEAAAIANLPIRRLWGVGETTAGVLSKAGIETIGQLAKADPVFLEKQLGKLAYEICELAKGKDDREVISAHAPKSIGKETTFATNLKSKTDILDQLLILSEKVGWRLRKNGYVGRTVTVKLRFASFRTLNRSHTFAEPICLDEAIYAAAGMLAAKMTLNEGVRLLGVSISNLEPGGKQISLFPDETEIKKKLVCQTVDKLKNKYGETVLMRGRVDEEKSKTKMP
ncbi:MAG: polymerase [Firmicutes bacterium]|nr:polymerase [Bacillota bacterium]